MNYLELLKKNCTLKLKEKIKVKIDWHTEKLHTSETEDDWLFTFLDVITLMLTLFVLLLTYSNFDEESYAALAGNITERFTTIKEIPSAKSQEVENAKASFIGNVEAMAGEFADFIDLFWVDGTANLEIKSNFLFNSGSNVLTSAGKKIIINLVPMLQKHKGKILIEGHTDKEPIHNEMFPSNWELSAGRAISVVKYLIKNDVEKKKLRVVGYADTKPLTMGKSDQMLEKNRRVNIVLAQD